MSVSISKAGPYFTSGSISFSALRNTFRFSGGTISASELRRYTDVNIRDPIVPDATENSSISSGSNLSLSQFRNSIKYYSITQSGTDLSLSLDLNYWNNNLGKNIVKNTYINGTNGVNTIDVAAIRHRGDRSPTRNLTITVNGAIYGAAGVGGGNSTASGFRDYISGTRGGGAFRIEGSGGGNATIRLIIRGIVWAGGGGGERGRTGSNGVNGLCRNVTSTQGCGTRPPCPSGFYTIGRSDGRCCESYCVGWPCKERCGKWLKRRDCAQDYEVPGGIGGLGGRGGNGRGWDNFGGSTSGGLGNPGTQGQNCSIFGGFTLRLSTNGQPGERGGDGGDWGRSGQDTGNIGKGGFAGPAIYGKFFTLEGNVNSNTVRGYIDYNFTFAAEYLQ